MKTTRVTLIMTTGRDETFLFDGEPLEAERAMVAFLGGGVPGASPVYVYDTGDGRRVVVPRSRVHSAIIG